MCFVGKMVVLDVLKNPMSSLPASRLKLPLSLVHFLFDVFWRSKWSKCYVPQCYLMSLNNNLVGLQIQWLFNVWSFGLEDLVCSVFLIPGVHMKARKVCRKVWCLSHMNPITGYSTLEYIPASTNSNLFQLLSLSLVKMAVLFTRNLQIWLIHQWIRQSNFKTFRFQDGFNTSNTSIEYLITRSGTAIPSNLLIVTTMSLTLLGDPVAITPR